MIYVTTRLNEFSNFNTRATLYVFYIEALLLYLLFDYLRTIISLSQEPGIVHLSSCRVF